MGFPGGASGKEPICQCRRLKRCGFHAWVRKIPKSERGLGNPLQYSCLENPMNGDPGSLWFIGSQRVGHDRSNMQHTQDFSSAIRNENTSKSFVDI